MKLLLVHNYYRDDGGESAVFRHLASLLPRFGHEVVEYTRDNREIDHLTGSAKLATVMASFSSGRTAAEVRAIVHSERPACALVQNVFPLISPSVYTQLKALAVPVLQLVYNYRFICPDSHLYTQGAICERCVRGSMINAALRRCYRDSRLMSTWYATILGLHRRRQTFMKIDHFLLPDEFMRRKLGDGGLPMQRMTVAGNPFDVSGYERASQEDDYALYVGRLMPQKGILTLIRAFARTKRPARLIVIGEGETRPEAERLAAEIAPGRVEFLGQVWGEVVRQYLARCMFLCVPSEWYDNAPLVLYQAFASAKPVIATRINGLPEVIHDGVDGLLVAPGAVQEWAAQMDRLACESQLRAVLGENAWRKAKADFTAEAYYQRLAVALRAVQR